MRRERDRFLLPTPQTEQRADSKTPKSRSVGTFRGIEPVVEIAFWSGRVQFCVDGTLIRLLVHDEPFRAGAHNRSVFVARHWTHLDRDRREVRAQRANAFDEVIAVNEFRVLARDQKNLAKA